MILNSILASSEKTLLEELWDYLIDTYLTPKYGAYVNITVDSDPLISPAAIFFAIFFAIMAACAVTVFNRRTLGRPVRLLLKHDAIGRKNAKTFEELGLDKTGIFKIFINRFTLSKAIRCVEEDEFYGIVDSEEDVEEPLNEGTPPLLEENDFDEAEAEPISQLSRLDYKKKLRAEKREEARRLSDYKVEEISSRSKNAHYVAAASKVKYKRRVESDRFYIEDGMQYRARIRFSTKGTNPMLLIAIAVVYVIIGVLVIKFLPDMLSFVDRALGNFR